MLTFRYAAFSADSDRDIRLVQHVSVRIWVAKSAEQPTTGDGLFFELLSVALQRFSAVAPELC